MKRWVLLSCAALAVALVLGACGGKDDNSSAKQTSSGTTGADRGSSGAVITIKDFAFTGATSTKVNSQVTIKNSDSTKHTFTPDQAGDFQGAVLESGQSTKIDFAKAGTFGFHCEIHSSMKGTIEVTG